MSSLPPIDASLLPADVRSAGPERREAYQAALGFERQLVEQLAKQLTATTRVEDSSNPESAATQSYRDLLPGALADAVTAAGGLGLAAQIAQSIATTKATA